MSWIFRSSVSVHTIFHTDKNASICSDGYRKAGLEAETQITGNYVEVED
jgi:hypothetical protein